MAGINKAILIGNLGKDPELRYTPSGQGVASFSLATTEQYNDKNGQKQKRTEWHNIIAWGKLGELANQYLRKGRPAYIEGRIETRSWDDKDGVKKYRTEINASVIQFLGAGAGPGGDDADSVPPPSEQYPASSGAPRSNASVAEQSAPVVEDDLPF